MIGSLLFFSPDGQTHHIDLEHSDRRALIQRLTDTVPVDCHIAGVIVTEPALPLMAVPNLRRSRHTRETSADLSTERTG